MSVRLNVKVKFLSKKSLQVSLHLYRDLSYQCHHIQSIFGFIIHFIATKNEKYYTT